VFLDLDAEVVGTQLKVWANATLLKDTNKDDLKIEAVLIEDENFWDGQYPIRMTARDMLFSTSADISKKGETARGSATINLDASWVVDDLYVIAFLQSHDDNSVMNAIISGPGADNFTIDNGPEVTGPAPTVTMDEDTQDTSIDMTTLFTDPDGDPIVFWGVLGSENIAAVKDASQKVTLTPAADWFDTETITLIAADEDNCPTEVEVQVTVNPVNDAPHKLGTLPGVTLLESQIKDAFNLYEYFDDIDNAELTFEASGFDRVGVTVKASGQVTMTGPSDLANGEEFSELITFKASDAGGLSVEDNSLVTVTAVNNPPVKDSAVTNIEMEEDSTDSSLKLSDHYSDPDDASLNYEITGNLFIDVDIDTDTVVTLTPEADWNGEEKLTLTVSDGTNPVLTDEFYVTVTAVNDAPILTTSSFEEVEFEEDEDYTTTAKVDTLFDDIDGDTLTYSLVGGTDDLEITLNQDLTVSFEPVKNWFGKEDYTIKASDGKVEVEYPATVEVTSVNDPVVIDSYSPLATSIDIRENDKVDFSVVASDEDGTEPNYIWSVNNEPKSDIGADYSFTTDYTSAGSYVVKVKVTDGDTEKTLTWNVKVRDLNRDPEVTITLPTEGDEYELTDEVSFKAETSDPDNDELTVKWTVDNKPLGNELEFTKGLTAGDHTIRVIVTDGKGGQAEDTVNLKVKGEEVTTTTTTGGSLSGAMIGGIIAVVIVVVIILALVAMKMRGPKEPMPTEEEMGPPPPQTDALAPIPPGPDQGYGGYEQYPAEPGYDQGGYDQPPPPPAY
jgi:hypothetical protein